MRRHPHLAGVRAALVTPLTGPLAGYGRSGALALGLWAADAGVALDVHDAHPDARRALRDAEAGRPDLIFGPYGSGPAATVAGATSRLVWNHGGATLPPAPTVVNVLAPAPTYWHGALRAVRITDPATSSAAVLHGPSGFGRVVAAGAAEEALALGFAVTLRTLPVGVPLDDEVAGADVVLVAGRFAEEREAATVLGPGRWRAAGLVGAGVDEVLGALGRRREGLLGPAQWVASAGTDPDEGPTAAAFARTYRHVAGADPPYPAAQAFAAGLIAARCVRDAGSLADGDVRAAAAVLDCTTLLGRFRLDPASGAQVGHRVLTVQWQDGRRRVVWPPERADATLRLMPRPSRGARQP